LAIHLAFAVAGMLMAPTLVLHAADGKSARPNIVFILADDMGYGDPKCFNPQSKCATPNIDRLASQGIRFTDAHAPGSVCVPSRYGLMTGRYPFRPEHLKPEKGPVIEAGRMTLASLLRQHGYTTAIVGKWHLGFEGGDQFDYSQSLRGGPLDRGFDYFFGEHASLDIPPYFFIENDRCVTPASGRIAANNSVPEWTPIQGAFWREGAIAPDFKHEQVLPTYTHKAVEYIEKHGKGESRPFFLYVAFTAPHTPWLPTEAFRGKSAGGMYGDWVTQVDDAAGQVLTALDRAGLADNTLVFFTSDNGPVWYPEDVAKYGHAAAGIFRGMKGDAWEAGHRMPFVARWPGKIAAGATSMQTVCFTDMLATFAALVDAKLPAGTGEDSCNILPVMLGKQLERPVREGTVIGTNKGSLAIRQGNWKLIPFLGSGGFSKPSRVKPKAGEPAGQLYNLADDPGETKNVYADHPEIVARLKALVEKYQREERSVPERP
jgi:arylsulfatase A-like enzyme